MPGLGEIAVVLLIVMLVFGAGMLPRIGDALGRTVRAVLKPEDED